MDGPLERLYPSHHFKRLNAAVAQWIEYWPPKPRVVGSIPASRTTSLGKFFVPAIYSGHHTEDRFLQQDMVEALA